jgi:hypothetical protein
MITNFYNKIVCNKLLSGVYVFANDKKCKPCPHRQSQLKVSDSFLKKFLSFKKFSTEKGKMIIEKVLIRNYTRLEEP